MNVLSRNVFGLCSPHNYVKNIFELQTHTHTHIKYFYTYLYAFFLILSLYLSPFRFFIILQTEKKNTARIISFIWVKKKECIYWDMNILISFFFISRASLLLRVCVIIFFLFVSFAVVHIEERRKQKHNPPTQRCRHAFSNGNPVMGRHLSAKHCQIIIGYDEWKRKVK